MTLDAIKQYMLGGGGIILILMTLVQISPLKINPWSWIGKLIGKFINGEVIEKVEAVNSEITAVKNDVHDFKDANNEEWASLSRTHILRFGDELLHGVAHSQEHFQQILIDIDKYETYCHDHPDYLNNIANQTIKQIKNTYQKCLEENKFI